MANNIANFPKGFTNGLTINGMPVFQTFSTSAGQANTSNSGVYWVDSNYGGDGNPGTYVLPLATLGRAIALAKAYDVIMLRPGHAETIINATAASTLWNGAANVSIVGLGYGAQRPTFTFTTANTATITVSKAGMSVQNVLFVGNFASIATVFTVTTAKDFRVDGCEFRDVDSTHGFLTVATTNSTANAADGLTFTNNRVFSASTSATAALIVAGTLNRLLVSQNFVNHTGANNNVSALLEHGALVLDNVEVSRNIVQSVNTDTASGALLVKTTATTGSGMIFDNYSYHLDVAAAILVTAAAVQYGQANNLSTGDTNTSAYVLPAIGAN